ncbi:MAG: hypothetical protein K8T10_01895 [Candidatus Eremiobacteraeota bacterium]|nr:hypothetical protein [Candidatus Eremiobacteraeota bacterium]
MYINVNTGEVDDFTLARDSNAHKNAMIMKKQFDSLSAKMLSQDNVDGVDFNKEKGEVALKGDNFKGEASFTQDKNLKTMSLHLKGIDVLANGRITDKTDTAKDLNTTFEVTQEKGFLGLGKERTVCKITEFGMQEALGMTSPMVQTAVFFAGGKAKYKSNLNIYR